MFYCTKISKGKVVHKQQCLFVQRMAEHNKITFSTLEEAQENGYALCACCQRKTDLFFIERNEIKKLCRENNWIEFNRMNNTAQIITPFSEWKISVVPEKRKVFLCRKIIDGYSENIHFKSIIDCLNYIINLYEGKNENIEDKSNIRRGDIYYAELPFREKSCIQSGNRPVIIVSNNKANEFSSVIQVIPLTTKEKKPFPAHIPIEALGLDRKSIALVEQTMLIDKSTITYYVGRITDTNCLRKLNQALAIQFGLPEI